MNLGTETEIVEFKKTTGELREGIVSISSMLNKNGYETLCTIGLRRLPGRDPAADGIKYALLHGAPLW